MEHTPLISYFGNVYESIYQFIIDSKALLLDKSDYLILGKVPIAFAESVLVHTGIDCYGYSINLCVSDAAHIFKHFTSLDTKPWIKEEFDLIPLLLADLKYYNHSKVGNEIHFSCKVKNDDLAFIIAFVATKKKKRVRIITAYKVK